MFKRLVLALERIAAANELQVKITERIMEINTTSEMLAKRVEEWRESSREWQKAYYELFDKTRGDAGGE